MPSQTDSQKYEIAVKNCSKIISDVEHIVEAYQRLLLEEGIELSKTIRELENSPFERARSKIESQLINLAVCGAFSCGKSFLISALVNRLKWYERQSSSEDIFEDQKVDGYVTFLPTAPEQTNSCPLDVIPLRLGEYSRFEVMFEDTKKWEDKSGVNPTDDELSRKMLAYATDIAQWRVARPSQDIPRNVIRARLYVANMPIPAIIHDLPGIGGAGETYLESVHQALRQADCIIYVASAIKELTDAELALLRFVEEISEQNRSPVFFVLSQIDRESEWKRVLEKNNQFLREYFTKDGKANKIFIGKGFMPLSAGAEAKAQELFNKNIIDQKKYENSIKKSGMPTLREALIEHLQNHSGPAHLQEIAVQMHGLLKLARRHIASNIQAETIPLQEAEKSIQESKELIKTLNAKNKVLLEDLEQLGKETLLAGFMHTDPDDLISLLQKEIEPLINSSDVTKEVEIDRIKQEIKRIRDEWLHRSRSGFVDTWNQAWSDYQKQTIILLHEKLAEAAKEASITYPVMPRDEHSPDLGQDAVNLKETIELVNVAWQVSAGIAAFGGSALGGSALAGNVIIGGTAIALGPIGIFLMVVGALGWGWAYMKKQADLRKFRKALIEYLPKYCDQVVEQLKKQAQEDLEKHKGKIVSVVRNLSSVQQDRITTLESRLKTGDLKAHQMRVGLLEELKKECTATDKFINDFYSNFAPTANFGGH